jgi:hypothetical protein
MRRPYVPPQTLTNSCHAPRLPLSDRLCQRPLCSCGRVGENPRMAGPKSMREHTHIPRDASNSQESVTLQSVTFPHTGTCTDAPKISRLAATRMQRREKRMVSLTWGEQGVFEEWKCAFDCSNIHHSRCYKKIRSSSAQERWPYLRPRTRRHQLHASKQVLLADQWPGGD